MLSFCNCTFRNWENFQYLCCNDKQFQPSFVCPFRTKVSGFSATSSNVTHKEEKQPFTFKGMWFIVTVKICIILMTSLHAATCQLFCFYLCVLSSQDFLNYDDDYEDFRWRQTAFMYLCHWEEKWKEKEKTNEWRWTVNHLKIAPGSQLLIHWHAWT